MSLIRPLVNALTALLGGRAAAGAQVSGGPEAELLISAIHGKYGSRALAGQLFIGATALAGVVIPVNANNLVSTFTLYNPATSGVNCEINKFALGIAGTTTAVIGDLALAWQNTAATTALASTTALANINNAKLGGASPKALLYSAATYTGTPAVLENLGISFGTTGAAPGPGVVNLDIDGTVIVPPGYSITLVGNAAQTQAMALTIKWTEVAV